MRKNLLVLLLVGLLVLGASQAVLAFGLGGEGRGMKEGICGGNRWFDALTPEEQEKIAEIKETYLARLTALKEKMRSLREAKDFAGLAEARAELAQLKQEIREQIQPLLPEEYREMCRQMGPGKRIWPRNKMMRCLRNNG